MSVNSNRNRVVGGLTSNQAVSINRQKSWLHMNSVVSTSNNLTQNQKDWSQQMSRENVRNRSSSFDAYKNRMAERDLEECVDIQMGYYERRTSSFCDIDYLYSEYEKSEYYGDFTAFWDSDETQEYVISSLKESWAFERDDPNGLVKQLEPYDDMMQCSVMDMNDRNPSDGVFARDGVIGDGKATVMEGFNASIQARISSIERQFLIKDMEKNGVSSDLVDKMRQQDSDAYERDMLSIRGARLADAKDYWYSNKYSEYSSTYGSSSTPDDIVEHISSKYLSKSKANQSQNDNKKQEQNQNVSSGELELGEDIFENMERIKQYNKQKSAEMKQKASNVAKTAVGIVNGTVDRYASLNAFVDKINRNGLADKQAAAKAGESLLESKMSKSKYV